VDDDAASVVRAGYDAIAERYLAWAAEIRDEPRARFTAELESRLAPSSSVVDLGCGAGIPTTRALAERHSVIGIDISPEQIGLARAFVPAAEFRCADLLDLSLPDATVDAVTALYSVIHVPRARHAELFERIRRWLRPGGFFLASLSAGGESDGVQDDFLGVPMYFSGFAVDDNQRLLRAAGFELLLSEVVTIQEPDGAATFLWVLGRR